MVSSGIFILGRFHYMSKNIVVLSGSPRKNGNTEKLAAAFIGGAESAGKNVVVFRTADMKIGGCMGCRHCFEEKGVCVQKDDMPPILEAIKAADTLVFVSPIYYFDMTAQLKLAIDRTFALLSVGTPVKKAVFLITCGDDTEKAAQGAVMTYNDICSYSKWEDAGVIICTGLHKPGEIDGRGELVKARELGREI
jgi:multimeric flavodoxin WrbA